MEKRTSIFTNGMIWFGVAISVSEIVCGIEIGEAAKLENIWFPLILGHVLGGVMLYFVGLIGARVRVNAMETTASTFGKYGSKFFAFLNLLQLIGWIAVLNAQGAMALAGLKLPISFPLTCVLLAVLIVCVMMIGEVVIKVGLWPMSVAAVLLFAAVLLLCLSSENTEAACISNERKFICLILLLANTSEGIA